MFRQTKLKFENDFCSNIEGLPNSFTRPKNNGNKQNEKNFSPLNIKRLYKDIEASSSPKILNKVDLNRHREKSHSNIPKDNKIMNHSTSVEKYSSKHKYHSIMDDSITIEKSAKNKISEVKKKYMY